MSIWSRIRDGVTELSWGNLFGQPDGSTDTQLPETIGRAGAARPAGTKAVDFTIAVIALSAKMAKADGVVSPEEITAFREVFHAAPEDMANVTYFFNLARRHASGAESYARQIVRLLDGNKAVLEDLLGALFHIAMADGRLDPAEDEYLARIARIFGFDDAAYRRMRGCQVSGMGCNGLEGGGTEADEPFLVLGVPPSASDAEVKARHRALVRENHPDAMLARGLPSEFITIGNRKLARINAAYDQILASRRRAAPIEVPG